MSQSKVLKVTETTTREVAVAVSLVVHARGDHQPAAILVRDSRVGDYAANPVEQGQALAHFLNDRLPSTTLSAMLHELHKLTGYVPGVSKDALDRS